MIARIATRPNPSCRHSRLSWSERYLQTIYFRRPSEKVEEVGETEKT